MKRSYGPGCAGKCERLLADLRGANLNSAESLIRFHDTLLFLRAFPQSARVAELADQLLADVETQALKFKTTSSAALAFDDESVSGIAGTTVRNTWTYELARLLAQRHAGQIIPEWNLDEQYRNMATILPDVMPLLSDDSFVEADTPYLNWMEAAAGKET